MSESLPGYWRENFRRLLHDWEGREAMIGLGIIVLTALGYGAWTSDAQVTKLASFAALAYFAILLLVLNPWKMWRDSQKEIGKYRDRLTPRLQFVFEPDVPPYLQHFTFREAGRLDRRVRIWRIGVKNISAVVIKRVRVVVESITFVRDGQPVPFTADAPAPIEHALNVMGIDRKSGHVSVAPGDFPGMYVDVAEQMTPHGHATPEWMSICYASGHRTQMSTRGKWVLGLRAEGGGTYCRVSVTIEASKEAPDIVMRLYRVA